MKIIADNTIPFLKGIIETAGDVTYLTSEQFTAEAVRDADVLIVRSVDKCSRNILEGSRVKLITSATIGFDHIDTAYCDEAGIVWKNAPGSNSQSVAEYILSCLMVMSLRTGESLAGKTVGIVGAGHVGTKVEKLCRTCGIKVILNDPPRALEEGSGGFVSLGEIAEECDIITFHTPFIREGCFPTYHLANVEFIDSLKRKPWLINSCRGSVFDTEAVLSGMQSGKIGHMILDCWENEPRISVPLLDLADIGTPHIAGFSADGKANATRMCLEEISCFFGIKMEGVNKVQPAPPVHPIIDLSVFTSNPIERAVFASFDPLPIDKALRDNPGKFEWFRGNYNHPREFGAYTIINAQAEEAVLLKTLGFRVIN